MTQKRRLRKFKATFENGGFWEYYLDLENQFVDFLDYVPYLDRNERTCSFRLGNLLLNLGGHVDSVFKEMAFYQGFRVHGHDECKEIREKVKRTRENIKLGKAPVGPPVDLGWGIVTAFVFSLLGGVTTWLATVGSQEIALWFRFVSGQ